MLILLFTYGLFYTSYKLGRPDLGLHDYRHYSRMVDTPLSLSVAKAPFILRQIPTIVAYGIKQAGIYYPNKTSFQQSTYYKTENDQRNFFALILSNYLAFVAAIAIMLSYLRSKGIDAPFPVIALMLGYFFTSLTVIAPLNGAYGWLCCVLLTIGVLERKMWLVIVGSLMALFSRETVLLFFMPLLAISFVQSREKRYLQPLLVCLTAGITLYLVRLFLVSGYEEHLTFGTTGRTTYRQILNADYLFQGYLTQGLVAFLCYKIYKADKSVGIAITASISVVALFCFAVRVGGAGRIIGECYPFLLVIYILQASKQKIFSRLQ